MWLLQLTKSDYPLKEINSHFDSRRKNQSIQLWLTLQRTCETILKAIWWSHSSLQRICSSCVRSPWFRVRSLPLSLWEKKTSACVRSATLTNCVKRRWLVGNANQDAWLSQHRSLSSFQLPVSFFSTTIEALIMRTCDVVLQCDVTKSQNWRRDYCRGVSGAAFSVGKKSFPLFRTLGVFNHRDLLHDELLQHDKTKEKKIDEEKLCHDVSVRNPQHFT